ncbi:MAG TPA: magnesium/cobalt transporter CorA [Polyangiaceae bacterium]|nr:magnesium/cobalt transporter CorA [Polyangiaceae bacterium]
MSEQGAGSAVDASAPHVVGFSANGMRGDIAFDAAALQAAMADGDVVWVRLERGEVAAAQATLATAFGIHTLVLEDLVSERERPKLDDYEAHALLVLRVPVGDAAALDLEPLAFTWGRTFVVSVEPERGACSRAVLERMHHGQKPSLRSAEALVHSLLDTTIDAYVPLVDDYRRRLDELEELILDRPEATSVYAFHDLHRRGHRLRTVLTATADLLAHGMRREDESFSAESKPYLRDSRDLVVQLLDQVSFGGQLTNSLIELRNSQLDQRMNEIMAWLSLVSTLFIPLSFVVGLYGMNFDHMPELHYRYAYPLVLCGLLGLAVAFFAYFRRRGWLGRRGPFAAVEIEQEARRKRSRKRRPRTDQ